MPQAFIDILGGVKMSHYTFDSGKFIIEQFHEGKPFASFLPGLAGLKESRCGRSM